MYAGDKPLYWCNPEKRTDCPKDACEHLGLGDCLGTVKPEYAQTDERGQPKLRYLNGMEAYKDIYKEKSRRNTMNKEEIINKVEKQADALQVYFNALIAKDLTDISKIISLSQELRAVYHQILELKNFYPEVQ